MTFPLAAVFLASVIVSAGCAHRDQIVLTPDDRSRFSAKVSDNRLLPKTEIGGSDRFVVIAIFDRDTFANYNEFVSDLGIPKMNEFGRTLLLLVAPRDVPKLLKMDGLKELHYLSTSIELTRLDPTFEIQMLRRLDGEKTPTDVDLVVRFRSVPTPEAKSVLEKTGLVVTPSDDGESWSVRGPLRALPSIMECQGVARIAEALPTAFGSSYGTSPVPFRGNLPSTDRAK